MRRTTSAKLSVVAAASLITACSSLAHNDVLIFGTETVVALDVGASATNAGTPEITIGYKREEAVWMPLLANGRNTTNKPTSDTMYEGQGDIGDARDSYSVFASFGARIEGAQTRGEVGLAQFFATGIAAQRLANNPAAVLALTVKPPEQGVADADAVAAVATGSATNTLASEEKDLSEKLYECAKRNGNKIYQSPPAGLNQKDIADYSEAYKDVSGASDIQRMIRDFPGFAASAQAQAQLAGCTI